MKSKILIIGAGPAGLTAAYKLGRTGHHVELLEADPFVVGGLSKTIRHNGFSFDIGGHRFYTKSQEVKDFWKELMPEGLIVKQRLSRIYFRQKFFSYPLKIDEVFSKFGLIECSNFFFSFLKAKLFYHTRQDSFENWVIRNFGRKLYLTFFKSYTEKVWGIPCHKISADWAAQRISGLNLFSIAQNAIKNLFFRKQSQVKSLISYFEYPAHGPGEMWEICLKKSQEFGVKLHLGQKVDFIQYSAIQKKYSLRTTSGRTWSDLDHVISTMPLKDLAYAFRQDFPQGIQQELASLTYRDFLTIAVMYKGKSPFADNWLYIHDDRVKAARIQNYKNWSDKMVPGPEYVCLGLEYFCQEGDSFWSLEDSQLSKIAKEDLNLLKFLPQNQCELEFKVIKVSKAYPIYSDDYKRKITLLRTMLETKFPDLHLCGRNGLHRYNNQDHSIITAILVARNIIEKAHFSPWKVNQDALYIEEEK